jgi:hypothetical protein
MLPNTNLSTMLVATSAKKTIDSQLSSSSEEESEEQKILSEAKDHKDIGGFIYKNRFWSSIIIII